MPRPSADTYVHAITRQHMAHTTPFKKCLSCNIHHTWRPEKTYITGDRRDEGVEVVRWQVRVLRLFDFILIERVYVCVYIEVSDFSPYLYSRGVCAVLALAPLDLQYTEIHT